MSCLNEARIQAVADGEGIASEVDHVRTCSACQSRVSETEADLRDFAREMAAMSVPAMPRPRAGATALRAQPPARTPRPAWIVAGAAVAAMIVALFIVFPSIDSRTRLNAAEILNRSLATLSGSGVELLKYELSVEGMRMAPAENGTFLIEQLVDHEHGRWRFARFAADGTLLSGLAEDPGARRREAVIRDGDRSYRFSFAIEKGEELPLWDLQRRYAEALIRVIQATPVQLGTSQGVDGSQYVIELPEAAATSGSPLFDLNRARIVIDADDFHIVELSAAGSAAREPVAVNYRLIERSVWGSQPPGVDFALPVDDGAIVLQGDATPHVAADVMSLLLREVAARRQ
jgi:hypothetical protein